MSTIRSINPATGEVVGEVGVTPVEDIDAVVARARQAQSGWAALSLEERVAAVSAAGPILRDRAETIGRLITAEMGKPLREGLGEVKAATAGFENTAQAIAAALAPEVTQSDTIRSTLYRDPFGVAACISPWNFPILMPHEQILPALVAGNTVVFKPSEETPLTGQAYADALIEVLPDGVLQVVHGADAQGKALVASAVNLVVFTGSREAGKHILAAASRGLKRVILELGGKDPLIVLDDADLQSAARFAARNSFRNAGQVCVSTERIYVLDDVHDAFVDALVTAAGKMKVGDGMAPDTRVGPMVNARQRDHVVAQVDDAVQHGATVAYSGGEPHELFVPPVVLTDITQDMVIAREETFGPVACVIRVDDAEQAVSLANDTPFGLGAAVFGGPDAARDVARRLTAGMVGINQGLVTAGDMPWVGAGESGYGFHSGRDGHRQFAQVRVVSERR